MMRPSTRRSAWWRSSRCRTASCWSSLPRIAPPRPGHRRWRRPARGCRSPWCRAPRMRPARCAGTSNGIIRLITPRTSSICSTRWQGDRSITGTGRARGGCRGGLPLRCSGRGSARPNRPTVGNAMARGDPRRCPAHPGSPAAAALGARVVRARSSAGAPGGGRDVNARPRRGVSPVRS